MTQVRAFGRSGIRWVGIALLCAAVVAPLAAQNGLTIYNDGRVLVRRSMPASVPKGASEHRLELGPLDPSTLVSLDPGVTIVRGVFDAAETEEAVLRRLVGQALSVERPRAGGGYEAFPVKLLGVDPVRFLMPDGTVAFNAPGALRYPASAVASSPTGAISITSATARKDLPLGWFTDGAQWSASYNVVLAAKDARVSGEAVLVSHALRADDADVQLLAGSVSRAMPAAPAYAKGRGQVMAMEARADMAMPSQEQAGEFHLYTLPGKVSLRPGSTTTIALFDPATTAYEKRLVVRGQLPWIGFIPQVPDEHDVPVEVSYVIKRPRKTALGDVPLPGGVARIYDPDSEGRLQLVGEASLGHSAAGEDLTLFAGNAFDLTAKRVQTDYVTTPERRGGVTRTIATLAYRVTIRNAGEAAQSVDIREERGGEWTVEASSVPAEKVSSAVTRFRVSVPAGGETVLTYRIRAVW
jgi:hypothetical protein